MGMHTCRLVYEQIMNDNIVKHCCNDIKYVCIGEVSIVGKYSTLVNT